MSAISLLLLPEELIERILSDVFTPSPKTTENATITPEDYPLSPLLTCKTIYRVSAPLFYRNITLQSPGQTASLLSTLESYPERARWIRSLVLEGVWQEGLKEVLALCGSLKSLDFVLDDAWEGRMRVSTHGRASARTVLDDGANIAGVLGFCDALRSIPNLRSLTIRKGSATYMTQFGPAAILDNIGTCIQSWDELRHVEIAFKYSKVSSSRSARPPRGGSETSASPSISLTAALAHSPKLQMVITIMPAIWNEELLEVSTNPSLNSILLVSDPPAPRPSVTARPILPTALYIKMASKHPRLMSLIQAGRQVPSYNDMLANAGTGIVGRGRARTVDYGSPDRKGDYKGPDIPKIVTPRDACPTGSRGLTRGKLGARRSSAV